MTVAARSKIEYKGEQLELYTPEGYRTIDFPDYPYAFVLKGFKHVISRFPGCEYEQSGLKTLDGRLVDRYYCDRPQKIAKIRDLVGVRRTFEADIRYILRMLYDKKILVDYAYSVVYLDIEVDDSRGFPSLSRAGEYEIVSIAYGWEGKTWFLHKDDFPSEHDMLLELARIMDRERRTVVVGWNVGFDETHLRARARKLGIDHPWYRLFEAMDLKPMYEFQVKGLESYSLLEVTRHESSNGVPVKIDPGKRVHEMTRQELEEYNRRDVEAVEAIDKLYGFTTVETRRAEIVNLTLSEMTPMSTAEALILRRIRELGYVAPNKDARPKNDLEGGYPGAIVWIRDAGIFSNVAVYDFASLYPNVIINEKIDIPPFKGEVLPHIERELLDLRAKAKKKCKEGDQRACIAQNVYKIMANSVYGVFGTPHFRFATRKIAEAITGGGRRQLMRLKEAVESIGLQVLYMDTDSSFVLLPEEYGENEARALEAYINSVVSPYSVKLEYIFDKILFFRDERGEPVKKRYIGLIRGGGIKITGLDMKRGDRFRLLKEVQRSLIDMVFNGSSKDELESYLKRVKTELYAGMHDRELVICIGFDANKEYKNETMHLKAYKRARECGYEPTETKICFYKSKRGPVPVDNETFKPVCVNSPRPDYAYYWRRIMRVASTIMRSAFGYKRQATLDAYT